MKETTTGWYPTDKSTDLEAAALLQMRAWSQDNASVAGPTHEYVFYPGRKWAFDFAFLGTWTAVEIEGGTWTGGRHTRGRGFSNDCEKYNAAQMEGWTVFRFTSDMITKGDIYKFMDDAHAKGLL